MNKNLIEVVRILLVRMGATIHWKEVSTAINTKWDIYLDKKNT